MNPIKFIMAARCESAGRPNNEDNFQLADNLADNQWSFKTDNEVNLGNKGALLIVCDGMGGMNAGEVASQIAVETVKDWFASERLTDEVTATSENIILHIQNTIIAADAQIKEEGKKDSKKEGMGSTIVLAWLIDQSVYIGWCGDSRAYLFNPAVGLKRLSHDHSYVQNLVDSGQLSEELAFNHPNGNIITKSLGDIYQTAEPDVAVFPLHDGDIIMLCSDGLNGVLRDQTIEVLMRTNTEKMASCRDALWDAARDAGWYDNVTIGLCKIVSGCETKNTRPEEESAVSPKITIKQIMIFIAGLILGIMVGFAVKMVMEGFYK